MSMRSFEEVSKKLVTFWVNLRVLDVSFSRHVLSNLSNAKNQVPELGCSGFAQDTVVT